MEMSWLVILKPVNDKPVKPKKEKRNSNVSDESFRANTFDMMPDE